MTDLQAAVGREQLKRLPEIVGRRREIAESYRRNLEHVSGLRVPREPDWARTNWQSYCVGLPEHLGQKEVMQALLDCGISTRRGIMCAHQEEAYETQPWRVAGTLVHSEHAHERSLLLPLFPQITKAEQEYVVSSLTRIVSRSSQCVSEPQPDASYTTH